MCICYPNYCNVVLLGERAVMRMRKDGDHRNSRRAVGDQRRYAGTNGDLGGLDQVVVVG